MSSHLLEEPSVAAETPGEATPEQLLEIEDDHRFELIDGKLVERHMGIQSSKVGFKVMFLLGQYVFLKKLGDLFGADCGYQIFAAEPKRVRYPDGSFIAQGRLPKDGAAGGYARIPPDLAVEAVSPNDTAEEVETKRVAFLRAGVRLLWIIYPENRTIHVCRPDGAIFARSEGDELSGEDVVPGFVCKVSEIFEVL